MKRQTPQLFIGALGVLALLLIASCNPRIDPPTQSITFEEVRELQNEFVETRAPLLEAGLGFEDTRDFWFSLDTLKNYIKYVEQEAKRQGYDNLGIRVYFAAYDEPQGNQEFPYSTVVLVPTTTIDGFSGLQKGFFPVQETIENLDSINALNYGGGGIPPNDY
ncbi:MAG: hypothetical protein AAFP76_06265 [Bacteroidota bacterium]